MSETLLYFIWFLVPAVFFLMALWSGLEKISKSSRPQDPKLLFKQGLFTLLCVVLAILIDHYLLRQELADMIPEWLPLLIIELFLLPLILWIMALLIGGSKEIEITKAPNVSKRRYH
jgi:hypothetical protein